MAALGATLRQRLRACTDEAQLLVRDVSKPNAGNGTDAEVDAEEAALTREGLLARARQVKARLSECIADARRLVGDGGGALAFKVHNVPAWPQARLAAWLKRNKVDVTVRARVRPLP